MQAGFAVFAATTVDSIHHEITPKGFRKSIFGQGHAKDPN
jgi:hypothetical protein